MCCYIYGKLLRTVSSLHFYWAQVSGTSSNNKSRNGGWRNLEEQFSDQVLCGLRGTCVDLAYYKELLETEPLDPDDDTMSSEDFFIWIDTPSGQAQLTFRLTLFPYDKDGSHLGVYFKWIPSTTKQDRQRKIRVVFAFAILDKDGGHFLETGENSGAYCKKENAWGFPSAFSKESITVPQTDRK